MEYDTNRAIAMVIHDGPAEMYGRTVFEALNEGQTRLTITFDIPAMDEKADKTFLNNRLESVAQIRKQLMESEIE